MYTIKLLIKSEIFPLSATMCFRFTLIMHVFVNLLYAHMCVHVVYVHKCLRLHRPEDNGYSGAQV